MERNNSFDNPYDNEPYMNDPDTAEQQSPKLPQEVTDDVVRYYSPMVYRIALTKTQSSYDADDIFQEVFMKLCMNKIGRAHV